MEFIYHYSKSYLPVIYTVLKQIKKLYKGFRDTMKNETLQHYLIETSWKFYNTKK